RQRRIALLTLSTRSGCPTRLASSVGVAGSSDRGEVVEELGLAAVTAGAHHWDATRVNALHGCQLAVVI
ncbi:MAG: hypothetical protein M3069_28095, partial [Chloroflexota bacterium]|nr:hypothetical protein [Chloroflexota bacterium]